MTHPQVLAQSTLQFALHSLIQQYSHSAVAGGHASSHSTTAAAAAAGAEPTQAPPPGAGHVGSSFSAVALPSVNLYFDGTNLEVVDLGGSLQSGGVSWCC